MTGRLTVLAGPSGVGKTPLVAALRRFHPELSSALSPIVLYNSRDPRPGEVDGVDYHFRSRPEIEQLGDRAGFVTCEVRGDLQGIDLGQLDTQLGEGGTAFFEGNPFVPDALERAGVFDRYPTLSIFVSPLSAAEIGFLVGPDRHVDLGEFVADVIRRKLLRRTRHHKGELSLGDLENIDRRAASAISELRMAPRYDHIIVNHDGEDSEHWSGLPYPISDAFRAVRSLANLLAGGDDPDVEHWAEGTIPL